MREETAKATEALESELSISRAQHEDRKKEVALLNQLLGRKQEDFLFSIEQLKDVKTWAKKTISEVEQKAKDELEKRDRRIYECEREIFRKQETVDQVLKLLHREKSKCERLVLSTNELTRKLEGDLEFKLRILNREVERVMKIGEDKFRVWPFKPGAKLEYKEEGVDLEVSSVSSQGDTAREDDYYETIFMGEHGTKVKGAGGAGKGAGKSKTAASPKGKAKSPPGKSKSPSPKRKG